MKAREAKLALQNLLLIPKEQQFPNIGPKTMAALERLKATPNDQEWTIPTEDDSDGIYRTDWRGFDEVSEISLRSLLPSHADFLVPFFIGNGRKYDLNALFLMAISKHETAAWTSNVFRTKANAMGISNAKSAISQASYNESIRLAAYSLSRPGGYYSKCKTLADVGKVYAPVGAANDPRSLNSYWPKQVARYWDEFEAKLKT